MTPARMDSIRARHSGRQPDLSSETSRRTMILLIRHAMTDAVGERLVSSLPGVHLSPEGVAQARELKARLACESLHAIYASPLERALETAAPIAEDHGLAVETIEELREVDYGDWTGRRFDELEQLPEWRYFNAARRCAAVPHGETAVNVQRRVMAALDGLQRLHQGDIIAAVTHAEVIRCAILHIIDASLDLWWNVEISPGSLTAIAYEQGRPRLLTVNERPGRRLSQL